MVPWTRRAERGTNSGDPLHAAGEDAALRRTASHRSYGISRRSRCVKFWCGQESLQDSFAAAIVIHADQSDVRRAHQWICVDGSRRAQPAFPKLGWTVSMGRRYPKMHAIGKS